MQRLLLRIALVFTLLVPSGTSVRASGPENAANGRELRRTPVVQVFEFTRDAVVNISCIQIVEHEAGMGGLFEPFFDFRSPLGFENQKHRITSVGSGFLLHQDGYVITNAHVVMKTVDQRVIFADGSEFKARPVAIDSKSDLAVLKIDADRPLPFLCLGTSKDLMIGETVLAIGNPLGYHHTLTTGVISALDRNLRFPGSVEYKGLIQTDAGINPGNSGGPLLNILGQLIGVNTAIRGDAENIGFAIPVGQLREALPGMLSLERLKRVRIGMHVGGGNEVFVEEVIPGSPAQQAGIRKGDRLLSIDGKPLSQDIEFYFYSLGKDAGDSMSLKLDRDGRQETVTLRLKAAPIPDGARLAGQMFGLHLAPLNPTLARALNLEGGVFVEGIARGSAADQAGIRQGMVIMTIAGDFPRDLDHVGLILEGVKPDETVVFHVWSVDRFGNQLLIRRPFRVPLRAARKNTPPAFQERMREDNPA